MGRNVVRFQCLILCSESGFILIWGSWWEKSDEEEYKGFKLFCEGEVHPIPSEVLWSSIIPLVWVSFVTLYFLGIWCSFASILDYYGHLDGAWSSFLLCLDVGHPSSSGLSLFCVFVGTFVVCFSGP